MRRKKVFVSLIAIAVLLLSVTSIFAEVSLDIELISSLVELEEILPIKGEVEVEKEMYFGFFRGVVKEIGDFHGLDGAKFVTVENEDKIPANFLISEDTYIVKNKEIKAGSTIVGFYDANAPMILIYPPQYRAMVVFVEDDEGENIKVDKFDENLVSVDNFLKLNISDQTEIITQDGDVFEGGLANRKLVVIYGASTKSIPAQTNPMQVIVLSEEEDEILDVNEMDILVDYEKIDGPQAYAKDNNFVMVPLKAIATKLGYDVNWDEETQSIMVGKGISLKVGVDYYVYMKTAPIYLGTPPEIVEGRTFVPLNFFGKVLPVDGAYVSETQIRIESNKILD